MGGSRVGGKQDGGYVIPVQDHSDKILYSFGVGKDVSFDIAMVQLGYTSYLYDHTVKRLPQKNEMLIFHRLGVASENTKNLRTIKCFLKKYGHENRKITLKMDIEGAEWDILSRIDENVLCSFDKIIIEYHDLLDSKKSDQIVSSLSKINKYFAAIHIHACNFGGVTYCGELVMPHYIQVSYVNRKFYKVCECSKILPTEYDYPDDSSRSDIWTGRW